MFVFFNSKDPSQRQDKAGLLNCNKNGSLLSKGNKLRQKWILTTKR